MRQSNSKNEIISKRFLIILLAISVITNVILITDKRLPDLISMLRAAFTPAPEAMLTDHVRGNANAKYTIIEYSDYQCSYCIRLHEVLKNITKEADMRWIFRHFPLSSHEFAAKAAEAAECAGEQGKFWEYTDALFALKGSFSENTFIKLARDLGLDSTAFIKSLDSGKYTSAVSLQHDNAEKYGIDGTPTFYLNGKMFNGFVPLKELQKLMEVK